MKNHIAIEPSCQQPGDCPDERPKAMPARSGKPTGKSPRRKRKDADLAAYYGESLPGLESTLCQPEVAVPWNPGDPPRWWVRLGTNGKSRSHSLMFGPESIETAKGAIGFHLLVTTANHFNGHGHTPSAYTTISQNETNKESTL